MVQAIEIKHTYKARTCSNVTLPAGTVSVIEVESHIPKTLKTTLFDFKPSDRFKNAGIHVEVVPLLYSTKEGGMQKQVQVLVNLELEPVKIKKGTVLGTFEDLTDFVEVVETPSSFENICEITSSEESDACTFKALHE